MGHRQQWDWGDGTVGEALAVQASGTEFRSYAPGQKPGTKANISNRRALEVEKGSQGSLASQYRQNLNSRFRERLLSQKVRWRAIEEDTQH